MNPNVLAEANPCLPFSDATRVAEMQSTRKMNRSKNPAILLLSLVIASIAPEQATGTTPTSPAPAQSPEPQSHLIEGASELAHASRFLDQGERADTAEERRKAYRAAERHADAAVLLMPESADAHFLRFAARGRLAQMQGLARAALQLASLQRELDVVLQLNPEHADALASRGGMLVKLPYLLGGNMEEGIRLLQHSISLEPQSVGKRLELAEAFHLNEQDEQARALVEEARGIAEASDSTQQIENVKKFTAALQKSCKGCELEILAR